MIYVVNGDYESILAQVQMAAYLLYRENSDEVWNEDNQFELGVIMSARITDNIYKKENIMYKLKYKLKDDENLYDLEIEGVSITDATNKFLVQMIDIYSVSITEFLDDGWEIYLAKVAINRSHLFEYSLKAREPYQVQATILENYIKVVSVEKVNPDIIQ